ncbi:serine/threonine protein kinase KIN1/2 [Nematocida sp. AWRm77]|nr:serine/threonine protein kinase KIN1/2 [Nematocida sp. AWRm77]
MQDNKMPSAHSSELKTSKENSYVLKEVIETGTTSQVYSGIETRSKKQVAIKVINRKKYVGIEKKQLREERILREVLVSFLLDHKHIVKLREFFFTDECFYLVFDYVKGEQLLKKVVKHKSLGESTARKYFKQVLSAVSYCHSYYLVHRDIKIENILIDKDDNAMLIDFGLSNFYDREGFLGTFCGSLYFAAPELLSGTLYEGPEVDVWSLGVVLYVMVCGRVPFDDKNIQHLYQKIIAGKITISGLSPELESLLRRMLDPNRATRITVAEIYTHPWIRETFDARARRKAVIDPSLAVYINHLFGGQFVQEKGGYSNALLTLSALFKDKPKGRILPRRMDSIVQFVSDRKLQVKKRLVKHWKGLRAKEDSVVMKIEETMRELGLVFEIASGKYVCSLEEACFALQLAKNRFSQAYGIEISTMDKTSKSTRIREIETVIKKMLKDSIRPPSIITAEISTPVSNLRKDKA